MRSLGRPVTGDLPGSRCVLCIKCVLEGGREGGDRSCCVELLLCVHSSTSLQSTYCVLVPCSFRANIVARLNLLSFQPVRGHCQLRSSDLLLGQRPTPWHDIQGFLQWPLPIRSYPAGHTSFTLIALSCLHCPASDVRVRPPRTCTCCSVCLEHPLPAILPANFSFGRQLGITSSRQSFQIPSLPLIALLLLYIPRIYLS